MTAKLLLLALTAAVSAFSSPVAAQVAAAPERAQRSGDLYAVLLEPGPAWKRGRPFGEQGLLDHFNYWMKLFREGRVVTAGPLGDDRGLVLLRAANQAEADSILAADPAIPAGIFTGSVRRYAPPMVNPAPLAAQRPGNSKQ